MALINTITTGNYGTAYAGDSSGVLTLQQDGVTIAKVVNAPAFSAYQSIQQTGIGSATSTKITFTTVEFDTSNNYSTTTSRFTPSVAGYYQINSTVQIPYVTSTAGLTISLWKNGLAYKTGSQSVGQSAGGGQYPTAVISNIVFLNGTTDYVEIYTYGTNNGSAYNTQTGQDRTAFQGFLVKAM